MATLSESLISGLDMSGYGPVEPPKAGLPTPNPAYEPGLNAYIRCPLPPVWSATPDSLRQYYQRDVVPQFRLFNPTPPQSSGSSGTTITNVTSGGSSGGGGGSGSSLVVSQTSMTTPNLSASKSFAGSITLAKSFQLLQVSANAACRIEIYGTKLEQSGDSGRGLDVPPPAGSAQNIITDIALDTSPYQWSWQDRCGSNNESPRTNTVYITITNLGNVSNKFTITLVYVPLGN